CQHYSGWTYSF
nr:immunoglobulin light chain junction region [Macaca mulatta]